MTDIPSVIFTIFAQAMRAFFTWALGCLVVAAVIGALLRLIFVVDLPWMVFKPWLHAHSHVAMLGWVFTGLFVSLVDQEGSDLRPGIARTFTVALAAVGGMVLFFPLQGYAPIPIALSTIHMILGYRLALHAWRRTAAWPAEGSRLLVRLALVLLVLSTLGIWAMPFIMAFGLAGTEIYYWSIQWFLHFQFNGWFWFGVMAIGSRWAETHGVPVRLDRFTTSLWLLSCLLTYALVIAWSERYTFIIAVNAVGVLVQLWAGWRTLMAMHRVRAQALVRTTPWLRLCIGMLLCAMMVKVAIQTALVWPTMAEMALTIRNYVIGFIHLNTLGVASSALFGYAITRGWLDERRPGMRAGLLLFFGGVLSSELLLFLQGTLLWMGAGMIPGYHAVLFGCSIPLPVGALLLLINAIRSMQRTAAPVSGG